MKSKKEVEAIVSAMGVFQAFISELVELVKKFGGSVENIYRLVTPEGRKTLEKIARIIADEPNQFLQLISSNESLILDAVDGTETLAKAKDIFAYIDSNFRGWGIDEKGPATKEMAVDVHELVKDATFSQMFGGLNADTNRLCLTQHQIKNFVKKHRGWLRTEGYATFFLFKSKDNFFVAYVYFHSDDSLFVRVYRFEHSRVWDAEYRPRVVVPRLA